MRKEPIIVIVGFLGAGKTTLLESLALSYLEEGFQPQIILNDYENAQLEAKRISSKLLSESLVRPLTGSCICCDGISELRESVNAIPEREKGVTLIEANGTSDSSKLLGFLGVGISDRFLPPVQVSVVDVKNWQKRILNNQLERSQVEIASLIVLSHTEGVSDERRQQVRDELIAINSSASIVGADELSPILLSSLSPSENKPTEFDHKKSHWSSCSVDLPDLPDLKAVLKLCESIPAEILRVKGFSRVGPDKNLTYFERCPDGQVYYRPFRGEPDFGPKLLSIGPGSEPEALEKVIQETLAV